jgi:ubiquitin C-terminal hydrolase
VDITVKAVTGLPHNIEYRSYNLIAVACREGYSASGGHYTAYIKRGKKWYKFDDLVRKFVVVNGSNYRNMINETNEYGYFFVVDNPTAMRP